MMAEPLDGPEQVRSRTKLRIPCEVYSRIVGYLRPVQNWHQGKQQEFGERKTFRVPESLDREEAPGQTCD
jgi:hypothetical protein